MKRLVKYPGILDKSAYAAWRTWADGSVLMQGADAPSAQLIIAPTQIGQGPLRRKINLSLDPRQAYRSGLRSPVPLIFHLRLPLIREGRS